MAILTPPALPVSAETFNLAGDSTDAVATDRRGIAARLRTEEAVAYFTALAMRGVPKILRAFVGGYVRKAVRFTLAKAADVIDPDAPAPPAVDGDTFAAAWD